MGGPWRARGFDPVAWRRPAPRVAAQAGIDDTGRLVIAYILAVVAVCGGLLIVLARLV